MLAKRLGVSQSAVTNLEHAENRGGITITKLSEVAAAMDCFLVYAIVPNSTLERIVWTQAHRVAAEVLGYTSQTMALEDQSVDDDRQSEAVDRFAAEILAKGNQWRESFKFAK